MKPTAQNFDVAIMMNNHKKKINELKRRKSNSKINNIAIYRDLFN